MNFKDLVLRRESCRDYAAIPVEREKLENMLECARLAPSACNSQPWNFTVVTKKETAAELAKCLQDLGMNKFTDNCPAFIVINEEKATLASRIAGALHSQHYAQMDIGIVVSHLALSAAELGLSTCILGWFDEDKLRKLLDIPKDKRIRLVLAVGYQNEQKEPRAKKRKAMEDIARFVED